MARKRHGLLRYARIGLAAADNFHQLHLRHGIECAFGKGNDVGYIWRLHILEELHGQRRQVGVVHRGGDFDPGYAALAARPALARAVGRAGAEDGAVVMACPRLRSAGRTGSEE